MKRTILSFVCLCVLSGCTKKASEGTSATGTVELPSASPTASETVSEPAGEVVGYDEYQAAAGHQSQKDSYTVGVICNYDISYDDGSVEKFEMDGVLELSNISKNAVGHYSQNMNSNGIQFELEGDYYNGRLYNTYNGVQYYEEHTIDQLKSIMLVPLDMVMFSESEIANLTCEETETSRRFTITLTDAAAKKYYSQRYDFSDMSSYDSFQVDSGTVVQVFDQDGVMTDEISDFHGSLELKGVKIESDYHSQAGYLLVNETEVLISDQVKKEQESYVSFVNIDTDAISEADIDDDSAEATVTDTFKKRLVNRLKYEVGEDGVYRTEYNDSESYAVDFANKQFTYSNHSMTYVYNWNGDSGSFESSCNYDFKTGTAGVGCQDEVVEMIQTVKLYLQMELYYCGLSLEDLQAE